MADEQQKSGGSQTIQRGAQAAQAVKGAIKTGKSIAAFAKGAAAGPYGAIAGAIVANRHMIGKILIVVLGLLMLPILFILMLPAIIFGSLDNPEPDIMNNDTIIMENITKASDVVWTVLKECHDDVLLEIANAIDVLGDNTSAVMKDQYLDSIDFDSNLIVSQYCASKDDYSEIDLKDLKKTVSSAKDNLFSYEETTSEDENEDGDTITTHTYTVAYAGNDYFADNVFDLSDEQRKLAYDYAENLTAAYGNSNDSSEAHAEVNAYVLRYSSLIRQYADTFGISEYYDLISAVMMAESGGTGTDVMQSSESRYNLKYPGTITDPVYSIECGVHTLADNIKEAGCTSPLDISRISLALQGYNFGNGYIQWAIDKYGGYSEANAQEFSKKMQEEQDLSSYGNPQYVSAVFKFYVFPFTSGAEGWGSPFIERDWRSVVTSEFGTRIDPITQKPGEFHEGIDIGFPQGTPINAVKDGVVETAVKSTTGYGWHIVIDHGDGTKTLYGHCSALLVTKGQRVEKGKMIARVGATGRVNGPHLHLNVEVN